ncbi:nicotinate (nicotinamide) nucleotide adenylyltransferase [bacterium]|nr:nicotinate (nicotinamide) nucleotide adenylyltransferase [bacterium]
MARPHARRLAPGRVGLLGGSFNPPHAGHVAISKEALKAAKLDEVWWLVSPHNPLKTEAPADMDARLEACGALLKGEPRIRPLGLEAELGTRYTVDTLERLTALYPQVRFVWLMGADNLAQFHLWKGWRRIAKLVPMLVFDRAPFSHTAMHAKAAMALKRFQRPLALEAVEQRGWALLRIRRRGESSTAMRGKTGAGEGNRTLT